MCGHGQTIRGDISSLKPGLYLQPRRSERIIASPSYLPLPSYVGMEDTYLLPGGYAGIHR
jgi:hypothetical protein